MEEKRKDLTSEKQKRLLQDLVREISREKIDFYYRSTGDVAYELESYIKGKSNLSVTDRTLLEPLSRQDIQILLSLH